jgi:hypothetical protein
MLHSAHRIHHTSTNQRRDSSLHWHAVPALNSLHGYAQCICNLLMFEQS